MDQFNVTTRISGPRFVQVVVSFHELFPVWQLKLDVYLGTDLLMDVLHMIRRYLVLTISPQWLSSALFHYWWWDYSMQPPYLRSFVLCDREEWKDEAGWKKAQLSSSVHLKISVGIRHLQEETPAAQADQSQFCSLQLWQRGADVQSATVARKLWALNIQI